MRIPKNLFLKNKIFLSPHSDDICFSLGVFAKTYKRGCIINIFTKTGYLPKTGGTSDADAVAIVTSIRKAEDEAFARAASLTNISLDLFDAPLRGLDPLLSCPSDEELQYVQKALMPKLLEISGEFDHGSMLFAPAGIGGHVDHLTIREFVIANFQELSTIFQIAFYEDLHYASDQELRSRGIKDLCNRVPATHELLRVRITLAGEVQTKLDLMGIYSSQFPSNEIDLHRYIPAEDKLKMPHEAFWLAIKKPWHKRILNFQSR